MHPLNLLSAVLIGFGLLINLQRLFIKRQIASLFFLLFWTYLAWGLWSGKSVAVMTAVGILIEAVKRRRDEQLRRLVFDAEFEEKPRRKKDANEEG